MPAAIRQCSQYVSDAELIRRVANRDELALGLLWPRYARRVYDTALRITGQAEVADEVAQDVCFALWRSAAAFEMGCSVVAWVDAIAAHRAIDATRAKSFRDRTRETPLERAAFRVSNDHEDTLVVQAALAHLLEKLPHDQREAITLNYVCGLPLATVAERLDVPLGTVKGRVRLGLARLRAWLADEPPTDEQAEAPYSFGMSAAPMRYFPDGSVDWGAMWQDFCLLARAGGPPHRGTMLIAETDSHPENAAYHMVVREIIRGVAAVSGLTATAAQSGRIAVACDSAAMAQWLGQSILLENVEARWHDTTLFLPAGVNYTLSGEIKSVITVVAKTIYYWRQPFSLERLGARFASRQTDLSKM